MSREVQQRFLSILAKTLPPATMGSGWTESVAAKDCTFIVNCYEHRDVFLRKKWILVFSFCINMSV